MGYGVSTRQLMSEACLERLACLSEELGENTQAIGKILRHGYHSYNPDGSHKKNNKELLELELGDVLASTILMIKAGDLDGQAINDRINIKLAKLAQYSHHEENRELCYSLLNMNKSLSKELTVT